VTSDTPVIAFLNHPSWWDPLLGFVLAFHLFPDRVSYAPIDATALDRYRFLGRLGLFGVEQGTARGARSFLHSAQAICSRPSSALWITPQGSIEDPRVRPIRFQAGLGHLVRRLDRAVLVPVAVEYPFWEERFPEALVLVGSPLMLGKSSARSSAGWTGVLESRLEEALDELSSRSLARDAGFFETLVSGRAGIGGIYDLWRRFRARLSGKEFRAKHGRI
jgi:1-acyl-sn-glycerol-3-phosphate acyltransferase